MAKLFSFGFWNNLAGLILRFRTLFLLVIIAFTIFLGTQWQHMRFSYTEANLLPKDHEINIKYQEFLSKFGDEGNLVVMAVNDSSLFSPEKFNAWNNFNKTIENYDEIQMVLSIGNLKVLEKENNPPRFEIVPFIKDSVTDAASLENYTSKLFDSLPFYEGLLYSNKSQTIQSGIYIKEAIVNTERRKDFILKKLIPAVEAFEEAYNLDVKVSGMPYIRTLNSKNINDEISIFLGAALGITSLIFFLFFRSFRATFISMITVIIGVMWAFGFLGWFRFEITALTAIIPPLIIVIGIPNCIFLINKYQQEIKKHGNKALSLQRVITKVGNATLMTNVTTASGFATFALTESKLLKEFGIVASVNILALFVLCLFVVPIIYSYLPSPKERHLQHLSKPWMERLVTWMERMVREKRIAVYIISICILISKYYRYLYD